MSLASEYSQALFQAIDQSLLSLSTSANFETADVQNYSNFKESIIKLSDIRARHSKPENNADLKRSLVESQHIFQLWLEHAPEENPLLQELQWICIGQMTANALHLVLQELLLQTTSLADYIAYWEEVKASRISRYIYLLQSLPLRLQNYVISVYRHSLHEETSAFRFHLFKKVLLEHCRLDAMWAEYRIGFRLPLDFYMSSELKVHIKAISDARETQALLIGLILSYWKEPDHQSWKSLVSGLIFVMDRVLFSAEYSLDVNTKRNLNIAAAKLYENIDLHLPALHSRLCNLVNQSIPKHKEQYAQFAVKFGVPSSLIRYWPLALLWSLSGSTIMRIVFNKRQKLRSWLIDLSSTMTDFLRNWIVRPFVDIYGTIRHDDNSVIALMGRNSLRTDMDSLERMVVEFAQDNTQYLDLSGDGLMSALDNVRHAVREGDLSPVLRSYEHDLRSPLKATISGQLVRSLLIQVQKTKVDMELALSGIDKLLKSQQLVFGFIGVTPSLIITALAYRRIAGLFGQQTLRSRYKCIGRMNRVLRRMEVLLLSNADGVITATTSPMLYGLLFSEIHLLQNHARTLPDPIRTDLITDSSRLVSPKLVPSGQLRMVDRMWRTLKT